MPRRGPLPHRGAQAAVRGAQRALAGGARAARPLRAEGWVPARLRSRRAARGRRAADRFRAAQGKAFARRPLRCGSQAQAPFPAAADRGGDQPERRRGARLPPRAAPPLSGIAGADRSRSRAGRGRRPGDRPRHRPRRQAAAGRGGGGCARRRQPRGPVGLQRRGGGARPVRLPGADGERGGTRDRRDHRRSLRRRPRADADRARRPSWSPISRSAAGGCSAPGGPSSSAARRRSTSCAAGWRTRAG